MPAVLIHMHDPFDPKKREIHRLDRPTTVRRLVSKHRSLRRHTSVFRPGGVYGRRRVREFNRPTVCLLNGCALRRSEWKRATVGPGDVVTFYAAPLGGGGSNPLQIVAAVAVLVLTVALQQWWLPALIGPTLLGSATAATIAATAGAAIIGAGLAYGLTALFAQPQARPMTAVGFGGDAQTSPTYNLAIQGNTARLEQPIPEIFGRHRIWPDFVGQPYVRYVDHEQFIHMGLGIGIGEYEIDTDQIKVGETPITSFEEIDYAIVEPNGAHDVDIWDPRWLPSQDIADTQIPGNENVPPSPWKGPFAANPPRTLISRLEFDLAAPRGLWQLDTGAGGYSAQSFVVDVEIQEIDDDGVAIGAWTALDTVTDTALSLTPRRYTYTYDLPSAGRWQVRMQRTDSQGLSSELANEVHWIGLRGRSIFTRKFAGMTSMGVVMKATGDLNSVTSRKVNLIVTRKLPTWDLYYGTGMGTELLPTRDPCDAIAYIARSSNGGRIADASIDLDGLYENRDEFADAGWTFDFVFDTSLTVAEALRRVARAVVGEIVVQGSKLRLVRDVPSLAPVAMFSPRNIRQGSVEISYKAVDSSTADALIVTYMDPVSWKSKDATIAFDDSPQERPTRVTLHGITNREQARSVGWWLARQNRYRRRVVKFNTEMEGLGVLFGDPVSFSHDVPRWGQTMEVLDWDDDTRVMTLSDAPDFSTSSDTHYVVIRDRTGHVAGPFEATAVDDEPNQIAVGAGDLPEIYVGGDEERTFVQFGPGEAYARPLKVKQVSPRSEDEVEIIAFDDDERMYEPIPEDTETDAVDFEDVVLHITENAQGINLRTLANEAGYVGVLNQNVTIIVDPGVEISSAGPTVAAVRRGTWPTDYAALNLVNLGTISGAGGPGGNGGFYTGVFYQGFPGTAGGTAIDVASGAISLDNSGGTIRAGGGGGGGATPSGLTPDINGAGAGGGGQGNVGGAGGTVLEGHGGTSGTAGSASAPGTGGDTGGGDGGAWGQPGEAGGSGLVDGITFAGGAAGAGGKAIKGSGNVTWIGDQGTIIGALA